MTNLHILFTGKQRGEKGHVPDCEESTVRKEEENSEKNESCNEPRSPTRK